jgi:hypothetical protein
VPGADDLLERAANAIAESQRLREVVETSLRQTRDEIAILKHVAASPDATTRATWERFLRRCSSAGPRQARRTAVPSAGRSCGLSLVKLAGKLGNHFHAVSLDCVFYTFVRIRKALKVTPAMAAGGSDNLRSMDKRLTARPARRGGSIVVTALGDFDPLVIILAYGSIDQAMLTGDPP